LKTSKRSTSRKRSGGKKRRTSDGRVVISRIASRKVEQEIAEETEDKDEKVKF
jgi:hypothetical protein